jgi:hypothetical protein
MAFKIILQKKKRKYLQIFLAKKSIMILKLIKMKIKKFKLYKMNRKIL